MARDDRVVDPPIDPGERVIRRDAALERPDRRGVEPRGEDGARAAGLDREAPRLTGAAEGGGAVTVAVAGPWWGRRIFHVREGVLGRAGPEALEEPPLPVCVVRAVRRGHADGGRGAARRGSAGGDHTAGSPDAGR